MREPLPFDPWTLGGVDEMIRNDISFGLFARCENPDCDWEGVRIRLDVTRLIKRFGIDKPKADVMFTCKRCRYFGRDRTQTIVEVGMKDEAGHWQQALKYCA